MEKKNSGTQRMASELSLLSDKKLPSQLATALKSWET